MVPILARFTTLKIRLVPLCIPPAGRPVKCLATVLVVTAEDIYIYYVCTNRRQMAKVGNT